MFPLATFALAVAGLQALVAAQTIDVNSISNATRSAWCTSQTTSCPLLCSQLPGESSKTKQNTCSASTLAFSCVCSNGMPPNASQFSQTIPYFICSEIANQCVNACSTGDSVCQSACRVNHPCGAQDPVRVTTSSTSATATSSGATSGQVYTGLAGSTGTATPNGKTNAASTVIDLGRSFGLVITISALLAGFAFVL